MPNDKVTVVPIDNSPDPVTQDGRKESTSTCFFASSLPMIPTGPLGASTANIVDDPKCTKPSEGGLEADLEPLSEKNTIFIRQIPQDIDKFINVPNKYQVVTGSKKRLYEVVETTDAITRRLFQREQPFVMRIINSDGEYVCELIGDPGIRGMRAYVKLQREDKMLGKVVQLSPFFACCNLSPSYHVHNEDGKTISKITWQKGKRIFSDDFQMYSLPKKKRKLLGSISRLNNAFSLEDQGQADMYALNFHDEKMDNLQKLHLIAAVVMLDFQFFHGRENRNSWSAAICCTICFCLLLLIVAAIIVAVYFSLGKSK